MKGGSMKRLNILLSAMIIYCSCLIAAPIYNMPLTLTQPDGTTFSCFASGDEYFHWLHDSEGYIIIQDSITGYYCYADTLSDGSLTASNKIASLTNKGIIKTFRVKNISIKEQEQTQFRYNPCSFDFVSAKNLVNGEQVVMNNIVIFIRFADQDEFSNTEIATIKSIMIDSTANSLSFKNYILESSFQKLKVNSFFYPQSTTILSYQDIHPRNYYLPYSANNPIGYQEAIRKQREDSLLVRAINVIKNQISPDINLDADNNSLIDNVVFVAKGGPGDFSTILWPHRWNMYQNCYINSKQVGTYNILLSNYLDLGTICHEFLHTLGAPDLYHKNPNSDNVMMHPVDLWDVMANTQSQPQQTSTYIKYKYLHWIDNIPSILHTGTYTLNPITVATNNCYTIPIPNQTEYLLLEYRKKTNIFDASIPNNGILIYRINPNISGNFEGREAGGVDDEVYIYRLYGDLNNDGYCNVASHYNGYGGLAFSDVSNPNDFMSDGTLGGVQISNFGTCSDNISFKVRFCGNPSFISTDVIYDSSNISSNNHAFNISTSGDITLATDISFGAYESITLNPGFYVPFGINFVANIITCD